MSVLDALITYFTTWFGDGVYAEYVVLLAVLFVTVVFSHIILYPTLSLLRAKTYYKYVVIATLVLFGMLVFSKLVLPYWPIGGVQDASEYVSHFISC